MSVLAYEGPSYCEEDESLRSTTAVCVYDSGVEHAADGMSTASTPADGMSMASTQCLDVFRTCIRLVVQLKR